MLFVHLIYVLANYIGVLVLLAEKCRVFLGVFFLILLAFGKTEENKSMQQSMQQKSYVDGN